MSDERFRGASVRNLPRPNKTYRSGRVCAEPGCETKLSIYSKWKYCWQHEPVHSYVPRGKRKSRSRSRLAGADTTAEQPGPLDEGPVRVAGDGG